MIYHLIAFCDISLLVVPMTSNPSRRISLNKFYGIFNRYDVFFIPSHPKT